MLSTVFSLIARAYSQRRRGETGLACRTGKPRTEPHSDRQRLTARCVITMTLALGVSACAGDDTFEVTEGFFGATAAEEPRAALVARDVLVAGGTAADAAVATYFTLAVTLPSSAGIGANGSCLVFNPPGGLAVSPFSVDRTGPDSDKNPSFELVAFPPRPASAQAPTVSVPLGPRAMFALHARYGRMRFEELLAGAERLARFGAPVSRALAVELARDGAILESDDTAARALLRDGRPLDQEERLVQLELAAMLARLRAEGVGGLYGGGLGSSFVEAARAAGYRIDPAVLREALPTVTPATGTIHDDHVWALVGADQGDTALGQVVFDLVLDGADWTADRSRAQADLAKALLLADAATAEGAVRLEEDAAERAMAGPTPASGDGPSAVRARQAVTLGARAAPSGGATSFYAVDRFGMGVSCAIGLGAPFGVGRMLPGLGLLPGVVEPGGADGPGAFTLMVANTNANQLHMTGYGTGGRAGLSALVTAALDHWETETPPSDAVAAQRSHMAAGSGLLVVEPGLTVDTARIGLDGLRLEPADRLGRAALFRCVNGIPRSELRCQQGGDPRSLGLTFFENE